MGHFTPDDGIQMMMLRLKKVGALCPVPLGAERACPEEQYHLLGLSGRQLGITLGTLLGVRQVA